MDYTPHPYQATAIDAIKRLPSVGLFLDMGLGKTVITLSAIVDLLAEKQIKRTLIIAPLQTAINTWPTEVEKWSHTKHLRTSLILGSASNRKSGVEAKADIYIINRENVQWLCDYCDTPDKWKWDMVVIDELSSFKNPSAKRFKALRRKLPIVKRVVGLTGTPAPNGYMDLWSEVYLLDMGKRLCRTITAYRQSFFHPVRMNGHIVYEWGLNVGAKEMIDKKLSDICVSMSAADYLSLPERIESEVFVQMTPNEKKLYDKFGKERVLPDIEVHGANAATTQAKLLQMANGFIYDDDKKAYDIHSHKIEAVDELIEASNGDSVLLFYWFQADKDKLINHFQNARELKTSDDVRDWNDGKIPLLLAHPASAGHGLNLQAGGNIIVWYGVPWSLELYQQANARLYRQGQTKSVRIYHILTKDTHDMDVLRSLRNKDMTQSSLLKSLKARIGQWK